MGTEFNKYDKEELERAATDFVDAFSGRCVEINKLGRRHTPAWTEVVKDWFASTATSNVVVDASPSCGKPGRGQVTIPPALAGLAPPRHTHGEFLFDLTHSVYPPYDNSDSTLKYGTAKWWETALNSKKDGENAGELLLAMESENGKAGNAVGNLRAVMEDASKLLACPARAKVVVFGSTTLKNRRQIMKLAGLLAACDRSKTWIGRAPHWLWLDLPWCTWEGEMRPRATLIQACAEATIWAYA